MLTKRIYYIDWMRILGIIAVFFIHAISFFHPIDWHVKNGDKSEIALVLFRFGFIWIMPLFFFLAGASGVFGTNKPFGQFFTNKTLRLLIPLAFGMLFLIPPQKYVEALTHNNFVGTYPEFLSAYFSGDQRLFPFGLQPSIGLICFSAYHLWFLAHLFIISIVTYPLIKLLERKGKSFMDGLSKITSFSGGALLLFIPVAIAFALMKKPFPHFTGWGDMTAYGLFFMFGYLYTRHEGLKQSLMKSQSISLVVGTIMTVLYLMSFNMKETFIGQLFQQSEGLGYYVFQMFSHILMVWCWIIFLVSLGIKYLDRDSKARQPLNDSVLPFYILHQTVLLLIGYFVVQWNWSILAKFLFIASSSFVTIVLLYRFVIKPIGFMRFIFGMSKLEKGRSLDTHQGEPGAIQASS